MKETSGYGKQVICCGAVKEVAALLNGKLKTVEKCFNGVPQSLGGCGSSQER